MLPDDVASQIAAGEVIERPASVVKELLENAIDAQASYIYIKVDEAGKRLVEVVDDGSGIPTGELALAVARHATSKLGGVDDLFHIQTLGFRGEALASIASVSRLTITSHPATEPIGARIRIDGGLIGNVEIVGSPTGTTVRVEDLFFNVPARLKFLKNDQTEMRHIESLVARYALAYAGIRFQLLQSGRESLQTTGNGDRREVLAALYGVDIGKQMVEVLAVDNDIKITGYISPISLTRSNRREIIFFINNRPVQDLSLATAVIQAYHTMLMVGRYPMAVIMVDLPPETVDVNVHPTKAEVRFREPGLIFSSVQRAVRRALLAHSPVPNLTTSSYWRTPEESTRNDISGPRWDLTVDNQVEPRVDQPGIEPFEMARQPGFDRSFSRTPILRLIGQVAMTYVVAEGPDGLYLIDQHAAHERVLFEKMMGQAENMGGVSIPAQSLLNPLPVELSMNHARIIEQQLAVLNRLGFQIEEFGGNTFLIRSLPALLAGMDPAAALRVLVEDFEEDESPLQSELEARIIARVCKRAAVKAGQLLSHEEQRSLLADLEACQSPRTCPHGRPTMIHLSVDLLERQFGRRGAR